MKTMLNFSSAIVIMLFIGCATTDNVDRTPPEVSIIEPENDEIGAPISITVNAIDNIRVSGVSLYIDGVFLERKTIPPYTFLWYSDYWGDGRGHLISANALDPSGNIGMAKPVTIDVLKMTKPKVEILSPEHNSIVQLQQVMLRWKPIDNTSFYTVQISDSLSTNFLIVDTKTSATSMLVNLVEERTYRWRVLPSTIGNIMGGWNKENVFHRTDQFTSIFGRKKFDALNSIFPTEDGGYILAGSTHALDKGGVLIKTNRDGRVQWERFFPGIEMAWFTTAIQSRDGGYVAAGLNSSKESPADRWIIKTDSSGNLEWSKTVLHDGAQGVNSIIQTSDGGYVVCGYAETDSDKIDIVLTKYDETFEIIWERTIGGKYHDEAFHVTATSDGGLLLSGMTQKGTDMASDRAIVIRMNFLGEEKWRRDLRSAGGARFAAGIEHKGKYFICGTSRTADNRQNAMVTAFDSTGKHLWTKTFGSLRDDAATGIAILNDTIAICGSYAADSLGMQDAWLLIIDSDGNEILSKQYGGKNYDGASGIVSVNGKLTLVGSTTSFSAGSSDGFLIITDLSGTVFQRPQEQ